MRTYLTLVRRELASYFVSLTGYVLLAAVGLLLGVSFSVLLPALRQEASAAPLTVVFYDTMYFWLILLLTAPVITMRLFAQEKFSGTFETLMTAPVSDLEVVLAKFTGAWLFYAVMWLPLPLGLLALRPYTSDPSAFDVRAMQVTFLGILLVGALFIAMGCFASSLTRNQIIAAMTSFALGLSVFMLSFLSYATDDPASLVAQVAAHVSLVEHMREFVRGVVDSRWLVFYLSLTGLFLYLTLKVVEARRWK
jgi:ABC-2 type transport system permease protein